MSDILYLNAQNTASFFISSFFDIFPDKEHLKLRHLKANIIDTFLLNN